MENVTGFIERDSNGVTLEVTNIGCFSEVLAYENTTSNPVRTSIITNDTCPITTGNYKAVNLFCEKFQLHYSIPVFLELHAGPRIDTHYIMYKINATKCH